MDPSSNDPAFLAATNRAIYSAMSAVDKEAVFVMQGWLFHSKFWGLPEIEAFLSGVDNKDMIILDLNSEAAPLWNKTNNFFGKSWIWNMLHNYGGVRGIYGDMPLVVSDPLSALAESNGTMIGIGITPEDATTNPALYELFAEMNWRETPIPDVDAWVKHYATIRYGVQSNWAQQAWVTLRQSAYHTFSNFRSPVAAAPALTMSVSRATDASGVVLATQQLLTAAASAEVPDSETLTYDVVDITRQSMANIFYDLTQLLEAVFQRYQFHGVNSTAAVKNIAQDMLDMIRDEDELLLSCPSFLMGAWIGSAKAQASNEEEAKMMQFNARNIVTMWGPQQNIEDCKRA